MQHWHLHRAGHWAMHLRTMRFRTVENTGCFISAFSTTDAAHLHWAMLSHDPFEPSVFEPWRILDVLDQLFILPIQHTFTEPSTETCTIRTKRFQTVEILAVLYEYFLLPVQHICTALDAKPITSEPSAFGPWENCVDWIGRRDCDSILRVRAHGIFLQEDFWFLQINERTCSVLYLHTDTRTRTTSC